MFLERAAKHIVAQVMVQEHGFVASREVSVHWRTSGDAWSTQPTPRVTISGSISVSYVGQPGRSVAPVIKRAPRS